MTWADYEYTTYAMAAMVNFGMKDALVDQLTNAYSIGQQVLKDRIDKAYQRVLDSPPVQEVANFFTVIETTSNTGAATENVLLAAQRKLVIDLPEGDEFNTMHFSSVFPFSATVDNYLAKWKYAYETWIVYADNVARAMSVFVIFYRVLIRIHRDPTPVEARMVTLSQSLNLVSGLFSLALEALKIFALLMVLAIPLRALAPFYNDYYDGCVDPAMGFHGPMEAQNLKSVAYRYAASNVTSVSLRDIFKVDNATSFVCAQGRLSSLIASDGLQNTYQFHLNSIPFPCSNISSVCSNDTDLEWSVPINDTVFNCSDLLSTSDMNVPLFLEELDQPIVEITCDWNKARYARIHQEYLKFFAAVFLNFLRIFYVVPGILLVHENAAVSLDR
jgi:hypothetical protein